MCNWKAKLLTKWINDYRYLTVAQFYNQFSMFPILAALSIIFPLGMVFGFGLIGGGINPEGLPYVVVGSAIVSVVTMGISVLANDLFFEKRLGAFVYYASLPVAKSAFLLAVLTIRFITIVPGIAVALVAGNILYDLNLVFSPWLVLIVPLTIISVAGIGAVIGLTFRSPQLVGVVANMSLFFVMFAAPVMIPSELLPGPLQLIGRALPPTYAASALRLAVTGSGPAAFAPDLLILLGFCVVSMTLVAFGTRWRAD